MDGKVCILLAKLVAVLLSKYAKNETHRACFVIAGLCECGLLNIGQWDYENDSANGCS